MWSLGELKNSNLKLNKCTLKGSIIKKSPPIYGYISGSMVPQFTGKLSSVYFPYCELISPRWATRCVRLDIL